MAYVVIAIKPASGTRYECRVYDLSARAPCAGGNHAPPPTRWIARSAFLFFVQRETHHDDQTCASCAALGRAFRV